ncbi:MAG: ATP-binding cassette domain-containing protein [Deltaproteobacteria bacterium]|nr:ATP-binding cassette domain-containing protein [Deltaproteobacteria bacterium]
MTVIKLERVGKSFGGKSVLESVTLSLNEGMILALVGPSGLGKTTVLEIMAGLMAPETGKVEIKKPIGLMPQDNLLIPWLSAAENLTYVLPKTLSAKERLNRAEFWLKRFGLEPKLSPKEMSGGMKRRLNLARAFCSNRQVILLDEPLAFVDDKWQETILDLIVEKATQGGAVALTGHQTPPGLMLAASSALKSAEIKSSPVILSL